MLNMLIFQNFNLSALFNQIDTERDYDLMFMDFFTSPVSVGPIEMLEVFTGVFMMHGILDLPVSNIYGFGADGMAFSISGTVPVIAGILPRIDLRATIDAVGIEIGFAHGASSASPIRGGAAADRLRGSDHADTLQGRGGDDLIFGGAGDDLLQGNGGDDLIFAGAGDDVLAGGAGQDVLVGDAGSNILRGGLGDDVLVGAASENRMVGGEGADAFVFVAGLGDGRHVLRGWEADERMVMLDAAAGVIVALADIAVSRLDNGARQFSYEDQTVIVQGGGGWRRDLFLEGAEAEALLLDRVGMPNILRIDDELGSNFFNDLFVI